ncbi:MAG: guanylate kinase [Legionella sp.]|nr:guanylate kinase [Legionella sp.]
MVQFFDGHSSANEHTLFVLSGPSGVGKSTVLDHLLTKFDHLEKLVSYTTREPRDNEKPGFSYKYISREKYAEMEDKGKFLQSVEYVGNYYGYTKKQILSVMQQGNNVVADVDYRALPILKAHFPNCITIFIVPPSREAVQSRLQSRGDLPEAIARRMQTYDETMEAIEDYEFKIVNKDGELSETLEAIDRIINEKCDLLNRLPI